MRLERVVRLKWRDVGVVKLYRGSGERSIGIAALTVQAFARSEGGHHFVRLIVRYKMRFDVRLFGRVGCTNCIGSGFGSLERFRYGECDVLAVVTNYVVFERWSAFFADTRKSRPGNRPKDLADISAMKNGMHARHFLGRRHIELCDVS